MLSKSVLSRKSYDIQEVSKPSSECSKTRNRLKKKIVSIYGERLIVISDKESSIIKVANYLGKDIEEYCDSLPPTSWPPTVEELSAESRFPPASVTSFLTNVLKSVGHGVSVNVQWLVDSYTDDFIHGVSKGEVISS